MKRDNAGGNTFWGIVAIISLGIFFAPYLIEAAKNHNLMLDENNDNVSTVRNFVATGKIQASGLSLFGTAPTAGQFLKVASDGLQIEGQAITAGVTGGGGIDAGAYKSVAYYPASAGEAGATVAPLSQVSNAVLATNGVSLPALTRTLPDEVQQNITKLGDLSQGIAGATASFTGGVTGNYFVGDGSQLTGISGVISTGTNGYIGVYSGTGQIVARQTISGASITAGTMPGDRISGPLTGTSILTTEPVNGGVSPFEVQGGTTLTAAMLAGGIIYVTTPSNGVTPTVVGIPTISGNTVAFNLVDLNGNGVTLQMTNGQALYKGASAGTAVFVNSGYSRASIAITCASLSGSCSFANVIGTGEVGTWNVK